VWVEIFALTLWMKTNYRRSVTAGDCGRVDDPTESGCKLSSKLESSSKTLDSPCAHVVIIFVLIFATGFDYEHEYD
jgi:hypothetical protein